MEYFKKAINKYCKIILINGEEINGMIKFINLKENIMFWENKEKILIINLKKLDYFKLYNNNKNNNNEKYELKNEDKELIKNNVDIIPLTENKLIKKLFEKLYKIFPNQTKWSGKNLIFGDIILKPPYNYNKDQNINNEYHLKIFEKNYKEIFYNKNT